MKRLVILTALLLCSHYAIGSENTPVTDCDKLAALPSDPNKVADGIDYGRLNANVAIPACQKATALYPNNGRLFFQYGRALEKGKRMKDAVDAYKNAVNLGHPGGYNNLGELYRDGKGVPKDINTAEKLFDAAAKSNYPEAQYNLAKLILEDDQDPDTVNQARSLLTAALNSGYLESKTLLDKLPIEQKLSEPKNDMVIDNNSTKQPPKNNELTSVAQNQISKPSAPSSNQIVAENSTPNTPSNQNPDLQSTSNGEIVQNTSTGETEYPDAPVQDKFVSKGFQDYIDRIKFPDNQAKEIFLSADNDFYNKRYKDAFNKLLNLANNNFSPALLNLVIFYERGITVSVDYKQALDLIVKAADAGYEKAQYKLATLYDPISNALNDEKLAIKYYKMSAEQGYPPALFNLAYFQDESNPNKFRYQLAGQPISTNQQEAVRLYKLSGSEGYVLAQVNLGIIYVNGMGVKKDYAEAFKWFEMAARQGNAMAQHNLGVMYELGNGVNKNIEMAKKLFEKAAKQGNQDAVRRLQTIIAEMKMASQQDVQVSNDNSNDKSFEVARCSEVDPVNHQPLRISNDIFLNWSEKNNDAYVETDTVQVQGGGGITATNQVASKRIPLAKISISQNKISFETLGGYIWIKNAYWELDRKNGNLDVTDANDRAELSGASTLLGAYHCIKGRGGL